MKKQGKSNTRLTRRQFLAATSAMAAFTILPRHVIAASGQTPPSDKLNVASIGVGGMQGGMDVRGMSSQNIYALCDVDESQLENTASSYPNARLYRDFREMLDKEYKNLDLVTVSTPDHMHASAAYWAMERGLGVYCQKPLTQSVWEARLLTKAAQKYKVATQMGNQGYSSDATRIACEIIWSGELGDITEVHSTSGSGFARDITIWPPVEEIPETLLWDLWTGRAPEHTYSSKICPIQWRGFLDYGTMMVGDWGIHQLGPANWALQLGSPTSIECFAVEGVNPVTFPSYACRFDFPERPNKYVPSRKMPPVTVYWYEGTMTNKFKAREALGIKSEGGGQPQGGGMPQGMPQMGQGGPQGMPQGMPQMGAGGPQGMPQGMPQMGAGGPQGMPQGMSMPQGAAACNTFYYGTKGYMGTGGRGESWTLLPESKMEGYKPPAEVIKRVPNANHYEDFIQSIKGGEASCSNFSVAGPYAEWMLLGTISWRFPNQKLLWDGKNLRFTNNEKANEYVRPYFRKGWELKDITV